MNWAYIFRAADLKLFYKRYKKTNCKLGFKNYGSIVYYKFPQYVKNSLLQKQNFRFVWKCD